MQMKCSECDCVVEKGQRIETCTADTDCCCQTVPMAPGAAGGRPSPSAGVG